MDRAALLLVCALATLVVSCGGERHRAARAVMRAHEQAAREAALEWLELLDDRDYEAAYDREAARVRAGGTVRQFSRSMTSRRTPFGRVLSRKFLGAGRSHRLTGAPDAEYVSVLFRTSFEYKAVTGERVILINDHGTWRVVDYRMY